MASLSMNIEIFYLLLFIWCLFALITFFVLLYKPAPYGRHSNSFGPSVSGTWGWIAMEIPSVLVYPLIYFTSECFKETYSLVFLSLWEMHYLHRTFIYAWRRNNLLRPMPLSIIVLGMIFNCFNAFLNSYWINVISKCSLNGVTAPLFFIGIALFILGFVINIVSDEKLLKLRQQGNFDYKIPLGGLYKYVSCPNYLGEVIEWFGFFLATLSPAAFTFFIWTSANLIPRALSHHSWYRKFFPNYPRERKAIFPFLL